MKNFFALLNGILIFVAVAFSGTIANIVEINKVRPEPVLIIDKGSSDGVAVGQRGVIKAVYKDPSGEYEMNIGIFIVRKVSERSAELKVESLGQGFAIDDARYVVFDSRLKPKQSEKPISESIETLIEQGDRQFDAGQFESALTAYQKAQKIEPENIIVRDKINECQKRIELQKNEKKFRSFLNKSDDELKKGQLKFALLYLYEAYRSYPQGQEEVKSKLLNLYQTNPEQTVANLEEKKTEFGTIYTEFISWFPGGTRTDQKGESAIEKFLRKVEKKATRIEKNSGGNWEVTLLNNLTLIHIPAGNFTVGSPPEHGDTDEHPAHKVYISDFLIGKYEVSFELFDLYCQEQNLPKPSDEGWGRGKRPVINVSWQNAQDFCKWLSTKTNLKFRLPTEAEWEKAARLIYPWGSKKPTPKLANFGKKVGETTPIGSYPLGASPYGVEDLAGNVWEWCLDWYSPDYYRVSSKDNPRGPENGTEKSVRGGSWADTENLIRSANRSKDKPDTRSNRIGFRVVLEIN